MKKALKLILNGIRVKLYNVAVGYNVSKVHKHINSKNFDKYSNRVIKYSKKLSNLVGEDCELLETMTDKEKIEWALLEDAIKVGVISTAVVAVIFIARKIQAV